MLPFNSPPTYPNMQQPYPNMQQPYPNMQQSQYANGQQLQSYNGQYSGQQLYPPLQEPNNADDSFWATSVIMPILCCG
jgi:hypothetical protein